MMVARTYYGIGPREAAVRAFDDLSPYVEQIVGLQAECAQLGPDYMAFGIALDGLETAAYHFTRRRHYYDALRGRDAPPAPSNNRLSDRNEAIAAFELLAPYVVQLRKLQSGCRPFGRDYLAIDIAKQSLESAAYHFTRIGSFYGAKSDSAGPVRPSA